MTIAYLFSLALIAMMFCAAIAWAVAGDYRQVAYWIAACVLNIAVLTMAGK